MKDDDIISTKFYAGEDCRHWFYIVEGWYPNKAAYKARHMTPCGNAKMAVKDITVSSGAPSKK